MRRTIKPVIGRLLCFLRCHRWHSGFWQTFCLRCGVSSGERMWEQGWGVGPSAEDLDQEKRINGVRGQ